MFGISGEHVLILLVVLLIFGPRKLPELGSSLGRAMKGFRDAMSGKDMESEPAPAVKPQQIVAEPVAAAATPSESAPAAQPEAARAPEARV